MDDIVRPSYAAPDKRRRPPQPRVEFVRAAAAAATAPDPAVAALVAQVDPSRLAASVSSLAAFPTRHSLSPHNVEAARWLRSEFLGLGYDEVSLHDFTVGGVVRHNVVCTKTGAADPTTFILIGAHYDSRMSDLDDATAAAPGSDDDASGVTALLELARLLRPVSTGCSVQFLAFSGEEQGLVGSTAYAAAANAQGLNVRLMINLDMIGHPEDPAHPTIIVERDMGNTQPGNDAASQREAARMAAAATTYTSLLAKLGPIYDSDYMPFEHFGYVCIGAFDGADDQPFYHSTTDTPDKVDRSFHADVVRMVLATVLAAAGQ